MKLRIFMPVKYKIFLDKGHSLAIPAKVLINVFSKQFCVSCKRFLTIKGMKLSILCPSNT